MKPAVAKAGQGEVGNSTNAAVKPLLGQVWAREQAAAQGLAARKGIDQELQMTQPTAQENVRLGTAGHVPLHDVCRSARLQPCLCWAGETQAKRCTTQHNPVQLSTGSAVSSLQRLG